MTAPALAQPCTHDGWGMHLDIWCGTHNHRVTVELEFDTLEQWWAFFDWLKTQGMVTTWSPAAYR